MVELYRHLCYGGQSFLIPLQLYTNTSFYLGRELQNPSTLISSKYNFLILITWHTKEAPHFRVN